MKKLVLIAAAALAVLATPALARPGVCIRQDDIRNWTALNDKEVVLENYRHQKALLKLIGTCSNLSYRETLEIRSPGASGLSCVDTGDVIVSRGFGLGGRCAVVSVTPYSGDMKPRRYHAHDDNADDHGGDHHEHDSD